MFSTAESLDLGLLSCNMPVIQDSVPTYEDFLVGLNADDFPGDVTDIFGSWRYDPYLDGASLSLELGQYMEVFSPYDSVLATHFSGDFATALSGILVIDPSVDVFNSFESFHSFGECTDLFCETSMRTRLDISDIADVTPPIVSGLAHVQHSARASGRNNPVGLFLEVDDWDDDDVIIFHNRAVLKVPLVRRNTIRCPRSITDRTVPLVRLPAIKRFTQHLQNIMTLVRRRCRHDL